MEHSIIVEFVPPDDEVKDVIQKNFSQIKQGDPEDYLEQYKNILTRVVGFHLFVNYFFQSAFFNYSEITLGLTPIDCGSSLRMEATTNEDVDDIESFISTFGTFLALSKCELLQIKAIGPEVTLVGYLDESGDEDSPEVLVCEEGDLESVLSAMREGWVDMDLYKGMESINNGSGTSGDWLGINDELQFWIFPRAGSITLQPVNRDPARWAGAYASFDQQMDSWTDIEYDVSIENIENESERIIHFKCGDLNISTHPPLCLVPDENGDLKTCSIKHTKGTYLMDEEMEKILKETGNWQEN